MSISQFLSSCRYLFTVSNSGLLSVQRPRPASHAHFCHRHISVTDTCGLNSSIDSMFWQNYQSNWLIILSERYERQTHLTRTASTCCEVHDTERNHSDEQVSSQLESTASVWVWGQNDHCTYLFELTSTSTQCKRYRCRQRSSLDVVSCYFQQTYTTVSRVTVAWTSPVSPR